MSPSLLYNFAPPSPDSPTDWRTVNDPVMGGVSESVFVATKEGAAFTGTVSLKQGGGFASVRSPEQAQDLSDAEGLSLRLRGDGKRYWLTTYTVAGGPVSYRSPVRPPEHWTTTFVPFTDLTPYRRGSKVPDAPPFDASQLRSMGFLIADKQAGSFRLEIARIEAGECRS